jgi:predicted nucleotidyltransferase
LFGSAAAGRFNQKTSDFDFVATFMNAAPDSDYGRRFLEFARALELLLDRPVDVITPESIKSPGFRSAIASSRQSVYAVQR